MRCAFNVMYLLVLFGVGLVSAGDLEPTAPPGPTMKTLDEIPSSWTRRLDTDNGEPDGCNSSRFKCIAETGDNAVLDMETGLVWQRSLDSETNTYNNAVGHCLASSISGWFGWRAPTTAELTSLMTTGVEPSLPIGHPFLGVEWSIDTPVWYVATTEYRTNTDHGYSFAAEFALHLVGQRPMEGDFKSWCVRGPE